MAIATSEWCQVGMVPSCSEENCREEFWKNLGPVSYCFGVISGKNRPINSIFGIFDYFCFFPGQNSPIHHADMGQLTFFLCILPAVGITSSMPGLAHRENTEKESGP